MSLGRYATSSDQQLRAIATRKPAAIVPAPVAMPSTVKDLPFWLQPGYEAFDYQGLVAMPAIAASAAVVLSVTAAPGWQGMVRRLSVNLTGPGFVDGSGSLIFRILRNGVAVRGYDSILTQLGDLRTPRETDGIPFGPGQTLQLTVENISYAGAESIVATFAGLYRQER